MTTTAPQTAEALIALIPSEFIRAGDLSGPVARHWLGEVAAALIASPLRQLREGSQLSRLTEMILRCDVGFNPIVSHDDERLRSHVAGLLSAQVMIRHLNPEGQGELAELLRQTDPKHGLPEQRAAAHCLMCLAGQQPRAETRRNIAPTHWITVLKALISHTDPHRLIQVWDEACAPVIWAPGHLTTITHLLTRHGLELPSYLAAHPDADWLMDSFRDGPNDLTAEEFTWSEARQLMAAAQAQAMAASHRDYAEARAALLYRRIHRWHPRPALRAVAAGVMNRLALGLSGTQLTPMSPALIPPMVACDDLTVLIQQTAARAERSGAGDAHLLMQQLNPTQQVELTARHELMALLITAYLKLHTRSAEPPLDQLNLALAAWEGGLVLGLGGDIALPPELIQRCVNEWENEQLMREDNS